MSVYGVIADAVFKHVFGKEEGEDHVTRDEIMRFITIDDASLARFTTEKKHEIDAANAAKEAAMAAAQKKLIEPIATELMESDCVHDATIIKGYIIENGGTPTENCFYLDDDQVTEHDVENCYEFTIGGTIAVADLRGKDRAIKFEVALTFVMDLDRNDRKVYATESEQWGIDDQMSSYGDLASLFKSNEHLFDVLKDISDMAITNERHREVVHATFDTNGG